MKQASRGKSKQASKIGFTLNGAALFLWAALLVLFSSLAISLLLEKYASVENNDNRNDSLNSKQKPEPSGGSSASETERQPYTYPVYELDFESILEKRRTALERYRSDREGPAASPVERRSGLSLQEFRDLYDGKWPVLLTDVVHSWPASAWTPELFNKTYAEERVMMLGVDKGKKSEMGLSVPLFLFLKHLHLGTPRSWTYVQDELFIVKRPHLYQQILPSIYTDEDFFKLFPAEVRPWDCFLLWGTAHSRSYLHIDPYNWTGTNAVIYGTKKWKLYPPGQDHLLYAFRATSGFPLETTKYQSPVDAFGGEKELKKYPLLKEAKFLEVEQKAGEMLFIPTGWFHQAFNAEPTLAIAGQMMNRNNYRFVLEEILKANDIGRDALPDGFHNLLPPDQVRIVMSLLPDTLLKKGRDVTEQIIKSHFDPPKKLNPQLKRQNQIN